MIISRLYIYTLYSYLFQHLLWSGKLRRDASGTIKAREGKKTRDWSQKRPLKVTSERKPNKRLLKTRQRRVDIEAHRRTKLSFVCSCLSSRQTDDVLVFFFLNVLYR